MASSVLYRPPARKNRGAWPPRSATPPTGLRLGDDKLIALREIAFDDLGRSAVFNTNGHRYRSRLAVAQHPSSGLSDTFAEGRRYRVFCCRTRLTGSGPFRQEAKRLVWERQYVVVLCFDDAGRCRHSWLEQAGAIVDGHYDVVGDDILYGGRRLAHLPDRALELPVWKGQHAKCRAVTFFDATNIGLAYARVHLHFGQVRSDKK